MLCWRYGLGERAVTAQHMRSLCPETLVRTHISSQLSMATVGKMLVLVFGG